LFNTVDHRQGKGELLGVGIHWSGSPRAWQLSPSASCLSASYSNPVESSASMAGLTFLKLNGAFWANCTIF